MTTRSNLKQPSIYIMANKRNGSLYVGVTSNLIQRIFQHKYNLTLGFAHKYGCKKLVYYEVFEDMENAIMREKQLKAGSRKQKVNLIEQTNIFWEDLYESICK